jgi:Ca-activated chloride channel family protein
MTDDLEGLKAALRAATPAPDPASKTKTLRLAMENFDRLQESQGGLRLSSDRPHGGADAKGVWKMIKTLTHRPILATATSALALCAVAFVGLPLVIQHPGPGPLVESPAPKLAPPAGTERPVAAALAATAPAPKLAEAPQAPANAGAVNDETPSVGGTVVAHKAAPPFAKRTAEAAGRSDQPTVAPMASTDALAKGGLTDSISGTDMARMGVAPAAPLASGMIATFAAPADAKLAPAPVPNTEAFANAAQNPVHVTAEEPVSTFSADVDTASYAVIRSSLNAGQLPPPEAVRIEEMVNYFPYAYPAPTGDQPFAAAIAVMPTPWNPGTELVRIGLQGKMPALADRPALNLVFLIDTSGSMEDANKLPLLKQSLRLMLPQLRPEDRVAIVTYAGSAGEVLQPTSDHAAIEAALDRLDAGGSTAGAEGIQLAYQVARGMARDGAVSRVLLATDGDFNVGLSDPDALKAMIADERKSGTYLSVLGFGRGNLDDATMQALAQNGNGTASYIDTLSEAQKVLGDQLTGALFPIADDVKIQVEWNPAQVAEYRLIGYETRALRREDFNNDRVDAGEVGAGLQVTALYEVTPPGSPALKNDALRYGPKVEPTGSSELGFLRLRWKAPGAATSQLAETPITGHEEADGEARFAAAVAGFGQLLEGSPYLGDWGWDQAIALAADAKGADPYGYRAEAVSLMRLGQSLSAQ